MALRYNKKSGEFVVVSDDEDRCRDAGLTLSTTTRGPGGEKVWFTDVPYAALPFYEEADEQAAEKLRPMWEDYCKSRATDADVDAPAPPGKEYMPFQKAAIAYARDHKDVLIGDEPGLGKTIQAVGISNDNDCRTNLVVCPASIRLNWKREIEQWSDLGAYESRPFPILNSRMLPYIGGRRTPPYVIVSYDLLRNPDLLELLCEEEWDHLILDESHYLKTMEAKRTRAVFGGGKTNLPNIAERSARITGLTGTPLPNRPRECYTIARALCWEAIDWMSYEAFCYRFNPSGMMENGAVIEKKGRLPELQSRLRSNFMIRRMKADVLKDLPDKQYELAYVEPNGRIREVLQRERLLEFTIQDLMDPNAEIFGQISTIRREMGEAKVPRIVEHVRFLLDIMELPKVILFLHHKTVMDECEEQLSKYGVCKVRGGMNSEAKNRNVWDFVSEGGKRLFMGQLDAAGFGIDGLQRVCSHAVFGEAAWTPGTNEQAVDRLHRHGQHDNVIAQFLVVEGSLDEKVLAKVLDKTQTIHKALDK